MIASRREGILDLMHPGAPLDKIVEIEGAFRVTVTNIRKSF